MCAFVLVCINRNLICGCTESSAACMLFDMHTILLLNLDYFTMHFYQKKKYPKFYVVRFKCRCAVVLDVCAVAVAGTFYVPVTALRL